MTRKYLNKESRQHVALAWQVIGMLETQERYIMQGKNHQEDKEKLKYLRMSLTYLRKYFNAWNDNLDPKEFKRVNKLIETTGLLFKDNYQARLKLKEWDNVVKDRVIEVKQDLIEDLLDQLIAANNMCYGCSKDKEEVKSCKLRNAMIAYDAPATTEDPKVCQFEYEPIDRKLERLNKLLDKKREEKKNGKQDRKQSNKIK